jgi:hypothetical protein
VSHSERIHRFGAIFQALFFVAFLGFAIFRIVRADLGLVLFDLAGMLWTAAWFRWELRQVRRARLTERYRAHLLSIRDDLLRERRPW